MGAVLAYDFAMARRSILILSLALLVVASSAAAAGPSAVDDRPRMRLMLVGGGFTDVFGPVEEKAGQILFFNDKGSLMSLRADLVVEVVPVPAATVPQAAQPAAPPARSDSASTRYSNLDLPENPPAPAPGDSADAAPGDSADAAPAPGDSGDAAPAETTTADAPTGVSVPAERTTLAGETEAAGSGADLQGAAEAAPEVSLVPVPSEIDGHDEAWWREQVNTLRAGIAKLEEDEAVAQRQYDCSLRGIDPAGPDCRPRVNQMALVGRQPTTRQQKDLATGLSSIRKDAEKRRGELSSFIDRAMRLGVPTGWLL